MMSFLPNLKLPAFHRSTRQEVSRQLTSMSLTNKGLLNPKGHNNCFLNSCVQVLWHVDVFRRSFREFKGHTCIGHSCIFCALQDLFTQFQHSSQSALPPDELRQALARCYQEQHRFQLGIMDDAAECFEKILEQIHFHLTGSDDLDSCSASHCLPHQKCALSVLEMTECACGETSEPLAFVQFVHYISAPSLGAAAKKKKQEASYSLGDGGLFGELVRSVSGEGEGRECATCHRVSPLKKMLLNSPDLVCIGMIWDSDQPVVDDIMNVVESIGTLLRVSDIFHRVMSEASSNEYWLSGMVAYYGHHYCTFCYHTVLRQWGFFDDANFRTVSTNWSDVVELCRKAHYQPLLLVYTNPFAEKITMTTAPTEITKAKSDTKSTSLTPVKEETTQGLQQSSSDSKSTPKTQPIHPPKQPLSHGSVALTGTNSGGTQSNSGTTTSASEPGYEIDTFSLRRMDNSGKKISLYPQLSRGFSIENAAMPTPSAPPLQPQSSSNQQQTATNAPLVFQSSKLPNPTSLGQTSSQKVPVHFQTSQASIPQTQSHGGFSRLPYNPMTQRANIPQQRYPYHQPPFASGPIQQPYQQMGAQGSNRSNVSFTGGYPQPTYPQRPPSQPNYGVPPTTRQTSPWRGHGEFNNLAQSNVSQPQPQSFLNQSSPQMSPRVSPAQSQQPVNVAQGFSSLPDSSIKHLSQEQRASSMQPQVSSSKHPSGPFSLLARPRPSPSRSVRPPNQGGEIGTSDTTTSDSVSSSSDSTGVNREDNLIEFSISPALLSPTKTNQNPNSQGHTPLLYPSPNSYLSSSTTDSTSSSPSQPDNQTSIGPLEQDLIELSVNHDMLQRVQQRYRGRQGIKQNSMDSSINLSMNSGTDRNTAPSKTLVDALGKTVTATKPIIEHNSSKPSNRVQNVDSCSVLVDVQNTQTNREEVVSHSDKVGGSVNVPPDPLYADPDMVHTMLTTNPSQQTVTNGATQTLPTEQETSSSSECMERPGLGEDPLYAVPEQVMARMRGKQTIVTPQVSENETTTSHSDIPASVKPLLQEAQDFWCKAESKKDSDLTLAKMNYSRAANLLLKVLLDPAVAKDQTLRQNINHKRQEALNKCSQMNELHNNTLKQRSQYDGNGTCSQCGQFRQLNTHQICGPCHLKNKISRN